MDNSLAQLRDIYLPEQISWWPLAPGWYILAGIVCLVIFSSVFLFKRHLANSHGKRIALHDLARYQQQYQDTQNSILACAQISELLKRVVLFYYPRTQVAGLQGDKWLDFLNQTSKNIDFNRAKVALLELPYQRHLGCVGNSPSDGSREQVAGRRNINCQQSLIKADFQNECDELFSLARSWIKQRGKPCLS